MKKLILIAVSLSMLMIPGFSLVYVNDIVPVFGPPADGIIEGYVVSGSAQFFTGCAEVMRVFAAYETGDDYDYAGGLTLAASNFATAAKEFRKAQATGLGAQATEKVDSLKTYDYSMFSGDSAREAIEFLQRGDVPGIYGRAAQDLEELAAICSALRGGFLAGKTDLAGMWALLQKISQAALFGNNATMLGRKAIN